MKRSNVLTIVVSALLIATGIFAGCTPATEPVTEPSDEAPEPTPTTEPTPEPVEKSFTLIAETIDWGEPITSMEVVVGEVAAKEAYAPEDFVLGTTVTYMDYTLGKKVTEDITRVVTEITAVGDKLICKLQATPLDPKCTAYSDSVDVYTLSLKGEDIPCAGLVSPLVDAFMEGNTANTNYRLFAPETEGPAPMVLWLHGAGEVGTDNRLPISANLVTNWILPENQVIFGENGAYVLAPQCDGTRMGHDPAAVKAIMDEVIAKYNVDTTRIYVGGCSMGGMSTIDMVTAYPDLFAAAFPICCASILQPEAASALAESGTVTYFIHCIADHVCTVANSMKSYMNLEETGAKVHSTMFDNVMFNGLPEEYIAMAAHNSWVYVHNNFDANGDDYDGTYYHDGMAEAELVQKYYKGELYDWTKLDRSVEGFSYDDQSTWIYNGEAYDATQETQTKETVSCLSVKPETLGYQDFFSWLAAQKLGE